MSNNTTEETSNLAAKQGGNPKISRNDIDRATIELAKSKLGPIHSNLRRLRDATKVKYPIVEDLIQCRQAELLAIGKYIQNEKLEPHLEEQLW